MKLNNFFNKAPGTPRPKEREVIHINNEYREAKLQASIDELTQDVDRLTVIDAEYRELRQKHFHIENELSDSKAAVEALTQQQLRLNQDVLYYESQMKEIADLKQSVKNAEISGEDFKQQLYTVTNRKIKQDEELLTVKNERDELSTENKSLSVIAHKAEMDTQALTEDFKNVKNHAEEVDKKFTDMSKIYIETKRTNSLLKDEMGYWQNLVESLQTTLDEKEEFSTQLKSWIGKLETEKGRTNVKAQRGENKVEELQTVVTEIGKSLEDALAEKDYLNAVNDQLKYKLSRAGYASVGSIAKKEGFKMALANSAINWNKNYLGTARPTLLKFAHREETHDHS